MSGLAHTVDHALKLADATYRKYSHLQAAFPDPQCAAYWAWFNTHGWKDVPGVKEALPPLPTPDIYRFSNTSDDWGYLLTSGATYRMVDDGLRAAGMDFAEVGAVLDFGCGPGRGVRGFLKHAKDLSVFGCDVDAAAIGWCQENLPFGEYAVNQELPPLEYADNTFGLVFSVSVFSHLSERSQAAWLAELRRVLRPGGVGILTIHGEHAVRRVMNEPAVFDMIEVDRDLFDAAARQVLDQRGFGFVPQAGGHLTTDLYGSTFIHREYVDREWARHFEIIDHHVAAVDNWQDAVIVRARP